MMLIRRDRFKPGVNAGSMADIAFLLLIFFLVTTTIAEEKGVLVKLPPFEYANPPGISPRNILSVRINGANKLMVEGTTISFSDLKDRTVHFITNPEQSPLLPSAPNKAVVSLTHDRGTTYEDYLAVYNELKAAYKQVWNDAAQARYVQDYEELPKGIQRKIRADFPQVISEAEPTDHTNL